MEPTSGDIMERAIEDWGWDLGDHAQAKRIDSGLRIFNNGGVVLDGTTAHVVSENKKATAPYTVNIDAGTCNCYDHTKEMEFVTMERGMGRNIVARDCKHIVAVRLEQTRQAMTPDREPALVGSPVRSRLVAKYGPSGDPFKDLFN
jgi:hypothetical protein